ncbi:serine/arginine repetitive matrix protein 1 [Triticum aestivum]|uniref:serine/arginine repetitive matrix protein 1 n=1 Tax=Triticum aestivum TaxID=4565 RepID=UPI001D01F8FC|nr:serine/arginine repetitive matrix protein 1-like [Triticum aestivum]
MGSSLPSKIEQFFFTTTHHSSPAQKTQAHLLSSQPSPCKRWCRATNSSVLQHISTPYPATAPPHRTATLAAAGARRDAVDGEHAVTPSREFTPRGRPRRAARYAATPSTEHTARAPPTPPEPAVGTSPAVRGAHRPSAEPCVKGSTARGAGSSGPVKRNEKKDFEQLVCKHFKHPPWQLHLLSEFFQL